MSQPHIIIPARKASTRLPNKMLADVAGLPLVVRTAQQALKTGWASITVATDDDAIAQVLAAHHIAFVMTDVNHATGTDRLSQACAQLGLDDDAVVVNVQGDEPLIDPAIIKAVAHTLATNPDCAIATAAHPIDSPDDIFNPNVVKVVCNAKGQALYFSRAPIPYARDGFAHNAAGLMQSALKLGAHAQLQRHIGIYAYTARFLRAYPHLSVSPIETLESLEQLRALWHGYRIAVTPWSGALVAGVDTEADLDRVRRHFN